MPQAPSRSRRTIVRPAQCRRDCNRAGQLEGRSGATSGQCTPTVARRLAMPHRCSPRTRSFRSRKPAQPNFSLTCMTQTRIPHALQVLTAPTIRILPLPLAARNSPVPTHPAPLVRIVAHHPPRDPRLHCFQRRMQLCIPADPRSNHIAVISDCAAHSAPATRVSHPVTCPYAAFSCANSPDHASAAPHIRSNARSRLMIRFTLGVRQRSAAASRAA